MCGEELELQLICSFIVFGVKERERDGFDSAGFQGQVMQWLGIYLSFKL
jgi:hypothetical protein